MAFEVDVGVIGAGVIGLACARAFAREGYSVAIFEQHHSFGTQTSSRSSEVVHAGIYYHPGSMKARLCVQGRALLYDFCSQFGVDYLRCGKLIVATSTSQEEKLHQLYATGAENGANDLCLLSSRQAKNIEPEIACTAALLSPSTGIIDSHGFMFELLNQAERCGTNLIRKAVVNRIVPLSSGFDVHVDGYEKYNVKVRWVVNAAGLGAQDVASSIEGFDTSCVPSLFLAKGNYFSLSGKSPFSRLIYPIPEPGGLGIHFTLDLSGGGRFGPDVEWIDAIDYNVDVNRSNLFYPSIRRYWPDLPDDSLKPAYCGIRAKLSGAGEPNADFYIQDESNHKLTGLLNLFGMESPGLTSAMAIAEECVILLGNK